MAQILGFIFVALFGLNGAWAQSMIAPDTGKRMYVDIRDLAIMQGPLQSEASILISDMISNPTLYFPNGVQFSRGAQGFDPATRSNAAYGVEFLPGIEKADDVRRFNLIAFFNLNTEFYFQKLIVDVSEVEQRVKKVVKDSAPVPLTHLQIQARVGIAQLHIVVEDANGFFKKIYPISIGSLDPLALTPEGKQTRTLSPHLPHAEINRFHSELERVKPEYYSGRPFLRVINPEQTEYGGFTPFGFHFQITQTLLRGFVSNGCFRMRDKDLYELTALLYGNSHENIPLQILPSADVGSTHPFPIIRDWYNRVKAVPDGKGGFTFEKNSHDLYVTERIMETP